jgi:hypothetical protein
VKRKHLFILKHFGRLVNKIHKQITPILLPHAKLSNFPDTTRKQNRFQTQATNSQEAPQVTRKSYTILIDHIQPFIFRGGVLWILLTLFYSKFQFQITISNFNFKIQLQIPISNLNSKCQMPIPNFHYERGCNQKKTLTNKHLRQIEITSFNALK